MVKELNKKFKAIPNKIMAVLPICLCNEKIYMAVETTSVKKNAFPVIAKASGKFNILLFNIKPTAAPKDAAEDIPKV
jgi:hypothetical protein